MARLQSTSAASGSSPFIFPRNPSGFDTQDSFDVEEVKVLHGAPAWHRKKWDGRARTLTWLAVGVTSTVDATMAPVIDTMRGWVGTVRYFNFGNMARAADSWPTHTNWNKARVIDLRLDLRSGGELRYDSVDLVIQPES